MDRRETAEAYALATIGLAKGVVEEYVAPAFKERRASTLAWGALAIGVIGYDLLCPKGETLSEGFDTFIEDHPAIAWGATALIAGHLTNIIPEKYDPIHRLVTR